MDLVDEDDEEMVVKSETSNGNTSELCLQDMQVLDEVKDDEEETKPAVKAVDTMDQIDQPTTEEKSDPPQDEGKQHGRCNIFY